MVRPVFALSIILTTMLLSFLIQTGIILKQSVINLNNETTMISPGSKSRVELQHQGMYPLSHPKDWSWPFWAAVPLYPYGKRRTALVF
ncbi:hypothetical protein [Nostoc sp. DedQUE09]|uniref:hypothetical protein n=1 Tax=Nostoc sp. DedQUE09 TaxID=3075394 RepID=UPI002AD4F837|nr:hypothetical protein [Nostoc sp. DedQUE09]MDZ7950507.1 hypothetical protein [Nostoc sp. DedQUE09]